MNIFDKIKQLKLIQPDTEYTERSRREVLSTSPMLLPKRLTVRQILARALEVTVAAGLVALFVVIITGGVVNSPLKPAPFAAVNPVALHAEAQAIDIQIQLAKLTYEASQATGTAESTVMAPGTAMPTMLSLAAATSTGAVASSSPTSTLSVDQALKALSN